MTSCVVKSCGARFVKWTPMRSVYRSKGSILFVLVNVSGVWGCGIVLVVVANLHACQCTKQMKSGNNNGPGGENTCALYKMHTTPSKTPPSQIKRAKNAILGGMHLTKCQQNNKNLHKKPKQHFIPNQSATRRSGLRRVFSDGLNNGNALPPSCVGKTALSPALLGCLSTFCFAQLTII